MLNEVSHNAASAVPTNVGLTAFQVAVVQAKVFEKTLEQVSEKREQETRAIEQKAAEQRQRVRERLAALRGGVDVVVDDKPEPKASDSGAKSDAPGRSVDIEV